MIKTNTILLGKWPALAFLLLLSLPAWSQKMYPEWVKSWGGPTAGEQPFSLITYENGNVYTTGSFSNIVDFDPDPGNTLNLTAQGNSDIFIMKLNPEGKLVWAKQLKSSAKQRGTGYDLALDKNGALLIGGQFTGTVDFDPGTGVTSLTATGNRNSFILKLDTAGTFIWAKVIEGDDNAANGIAIDDLGNVYATGTFDQTADFDPGTGTNFLFAASGSDIFLLKLNSNGDFVWAVQNLASDFGNVGRKVVVDNKNNIYVGSTKWIMSSNSAGGHLWKVDSAGNTIWEYTADGAGSDLLRDVSISTDGFIYATGMFADTVNFNTAGSPNIQVSKGTRDAFVLKIDPAGQVLWVRTIGSTIQSPSCDAIKVDIRGNVVVAGYLTGSIDFDPGPGTFNVSSQTLDRNDVLVWKLNSEGQFMDAFSFGSTSYDGAQRIDIDRFGTIYVTGQFATPGLADTGSARIDFDPGPGILDVPVYGGGDAYIAKFRCTDTNSSMLQKQFCGSFLFNGETYTKAGTYTQRLSNIAGCDSIITLELSLLMEEIPTIRINAFVLSTALPYSTYQWFRDGQPIAGATERNYSVTQNGSYVVEVTDENGCPGTSEAYVISNVGINDETLAKANISVYPNPATNTVYIRKPQEYLVSLWSIDGKQLLKPTIQNTISIAPLATGTYCLKITDEQGNRIKTELIAKIAH